VRLSGKRLRIGSLAALATALCAVAGFGQATSVAAPHITLTAESYFNVPGQIYSLNSYVQLFEKSHPGVTVKLTYVPFANLDTELLTQATARDLPNLLAVDNPFVSTMIGTGQVIPLSSMKGFSAKGYYPAVISEGLWKGKYYSLPVAGENSIALTYNIPMLKAAGITPPTTWAQLVTDAKALTTSSVQGMGLTCEAGEDTTWQWEPFFWGDGGKFDFSNISSTPGTDAMTLYQTLINNGSASKQCLQYSQTPSVSTLFVDGKVAMMLNGPWNFNTYIAAGENYGTYWGTAPVPVNKAGQKAVVPLGGEDWMISKSGGSAAEKAAFEFIEGMQTPAEELNLANQFGYIPARISVAKEFVKAAGPAWAPFVNQTLYAHPRNVPLGVNYPKVSEAVWTAIQAVVSGTSVSSALSTAQSAISGIH